MCFRKHRMSDTTLLKGLKIAGIESQNRGRSKSYAKKYGGAMSCFSHTPAFEQTPIRLSCSFDEVLMEREC